MITRSASGRSKEALAYVASVDEFDAKLLRATTISVVIGKRHVATSLGWSTWVLTKLCLAGVSLSRLTNFKQRPNRYKLYTLDHTLIAAIARNLVDASLMVHYLAEEGMSEQDWALRRTVIFLHDATTRYRMFKEVKKPDAEGFKMHMIELRAELGENERYRALPKEEQEKLLSGQAVFVGGLRSVARKAGWDIDEFDFAHAYLSSHIHSLPVSFLRMEEHGIDFVEPTDHQYAVAAFGLSIAARSLESAGNRVLKAFPDVQEAGPEWLQAVNRVRQR